MAVRKVLVLGGYDNFGKRITGRLSVIQGGLPPVFLNLHLNR